MSPRMTASIAGLLLSLALAGPTQADGAPAIEDRINHGVAAKLGLGLGVPYGGVGAGLDLGIPYVSVLGGLGTTVFGGMGWSGGLRVFFMDRTRKFRPHFSVVYGTTTVVMDGSAGYTLKGFGFYGGVDHDVGSPGGFVLTYGLGLITHEAAPQGLETGTPVKVLFGVNYQI